MTDAVPGAAGVADLIAALISDRATVATAESVTGGQLVAALTSVPGSSAVVRGAVVAYATDIKSWLLGVDPRVLADGGPVSAVVAEQMAAGARNALDATYGVATTGEAGPDSASSSPVGTVFVAVAGPSRTTTRRLWITGSREQVQRDAVEGALVLLAEVSAVDRSRTSGPSGEGIGNNGD